MTTKQFIHVSPFMGIVCVCVVCGLFASTTQLSNFCLLAGVYFFGVIFGKVLP